MATVIRTAIYSDLDMELTKQTDGDVKRDTEIEAVIHSLENIISTTQGSRRMLPEFAIDIHNLLFEPLDKRTAEMIGNRIVLAIETWETRVEIIKLNIDVNYDQNLYNMTLEFMLKPYDEIISIDFVLLAQ
jgi:phage baseplate assembly protein W